MEQERHTATGLLEGMPVHLELGAERLLVRVGDEAVPRHDVSLHRVTGVREQTGLLTGVLTVALGEESLTFTRVPKREIGPFAAALRSLAAAAPPPPEETVADPSPLAELERLGRLLEAGVVSQAEFDEAKRRLLDRL